MPTARYRLNGDKALFYDTDYDGAKISSLMDADLITNSPVFVWQQVLQAPAAIKKLQ